MSSSDPDLIQSLAEAAQDASAAGDDALSTEEVLNKVRFLLGRVAAVHLGAEEDLP